MNTHTKVQLYFRCENLSVSDALVIVKENGRELGRTEAVSSTSNPTFQKYVEIDFFFEIRQELDLCVYSPGKGTLHSPVSHARMSLGEAIASKDSVKTAPLDKGTITMSVTQTRDSAQLGTLELSISGKNLKKPFGSFEPQFALSRKLASGQLFEVYRSEVIKKSASPQWKTTTQLELGDLCGGEFQDRCIILSCHNGKKDMGSCLVTAAELKKGAGEFELTKDKDGKTKSYGYLVLNSTVFTPTVPFLEHMRRGMEINIAFSIDFTSSNGQWQNPNSLHYYNPQQPNQYIRAMLAVSDVVQEYDTDKQFPVYGFGAVTPFPVNSIHFFPLTGNYQNAYVSGMQAVVNTYAGLLPQLRFSGPTNFAPTIRALTEGARQAKGVYTILMIMTDGAITDMRDTIDAITDADDAPLSIIIIGIGNYNFSSMVQLDGDDERLVNSAGRLCRRDLVQFVPFDQFKNAPPERLAAAVLEEVPRQVEVWGRLNGIQ